MYASTPETTSDIWYLYMSVESAPDIRYLYMSVESAPDIGYLYMSAHYSRIMLSGHIAEMNIHCLLLSSLPNRLNTRICKLHKDN